MTALATSTTAVAKEAFLPTPSNTSSTHYISLALLLSPRYNGGLNAESSYPYLAKDTDSCRYVPSANVAYVPSGSYNITAGDEDALLRAIQQKGPVSVGFKVEAEFRDYKTGVYNTTSCLNLTAHDVNHAVLAVGFDVWTDPKTKKTTDYWIVKNSWGTEFGYEGYFYIERGNNMCAISECCAYPNLDGLTPPAGNGKKIEL